MVGNMPPNALVIDDPPGYLGDLPGRGVLLGYV